ncbi:MAG: beta-lactamase family protein [Flavobacteriaceae bacterium]
MRNRSSILLFSILCLFALTNCSNPTEQKSKLLNEKISRIENGLRSNLQIQYGDTISVQYYNIEKRMKELDIPGLSIAVLYEGKIEWAKGYGMADIFQNREVTTTTLFQAGSISKPIAATRVHQLAEEDVINLDTDVNDYLTSWKVPDNEFTAEEKVTPRRLLNHSAGLTVRGFPGYSIHDTVPNVIGVLNGKGNTEPIRVFRKPGEKVGYSGGGYTVMQQMIVDIDQRSFPEIMQEKILNPLKMTSSTFENPLPKKYHNDASAGYHSDGTEVIGKWHTYPEMAAAGLWTTPSQLLLWVHEIQQTLQTQKNGFLNTETVNEMLKDYGNNQGLGPYVVEHIFGHGGSDEGFVSDLRSWKEHPISVAIMVNSDNANTIIQELFLSIAKEYNLPGIYSRTRKFKELSHQNLMKYIGKYQFDNNMATITIKENGLEFTGGPASSPIFLLPESDTKFFSKKTGLYFSFNSNESSITGVEVVGYKAKKIE